MQTLAMNADRKPRSPLSALEISLREELLKDIVPHLVSLEYLLDHTNFSELRQLAQNSLRPDVIVEVDPGNFYGLGSFGDHVSFPLCHDVPAHFFTGPQWSSMLPGII